ncbi:MAG: tetratricopeptide repeat protein [Dongiaceae bacterium]
MLSRILICLTLLAGCAAPLWLAPPAFAATMEDVRKAMAEKRMFDAYQDLLELAQTGDPVAQYELGGFYHYGRVSAVNFEKARAWYERAAKQGNAYAMLGLAAMYGNGEGVEQDKAAAYRWLVLASSQHLDPEAAATVASTRDYLGQQLTPEQIEAALAEARSFVPRPE